MPFCWFYHDAAHLLFLLPLNIEPHHEKTCFCPMQTTKAHMPFCWFCHEVAHIIPRMLLMFLRWNFNTCSLHLHKRRLYHMRLFERLDFE